MLFRSRRQDKKTFASRHPQRCLNVLLVGMAECFKVIVIEYAKYGLPQISNVHNAQLDLLSSDLQMARFSESMPFETGARTYRVINQL